AVATFSASALDLIDPAPAVLCDHASGATFALGTTPVSCTATDAAGNTSAPPSIFNVVVQDTTKPDIPAQSNVGSEATSSAGAAVTYPAVTASDAVDGTIGAACLPASGSIFHLGTNTVTCNATDSHGNAATPRTFTITVADTT